MTTKGRLGKGKVPLVLAARGGLALLIAGAIGAVGMGCDRPPIDADSSGDVETTTGALVATISGTIRDTQGRALSGVTVQLNGRTMATQVTGNAGTYSFALNVPGTTGSWSVMPTCCINFAMCFRPASPCSARRRRRKYWRPTGSIPIGWPSLISRSISNPGLPGRCPMKVRRCRSRRT